MTNVFGKTGIATGLAAFMLVASLAPVPAAAANCHRRIERAEENLRRAIRKHGERSRQAEERRRQLEDIRARCHEYGRR